MVQEARSDTFPSGPLLFSAFPLEESLFFSTVASPPSLNEVADRSKGMRIGSDPFSS